MANHILSVKNLQVSFRTQEGILKAVRGINFDLDKGETLAIVGESGSGKSVTSKAIIGILSGNSIVEGGEILFERQDLLRIDEEHFHKIRGDKISMIFQDPLSSLNPIMRVGKQVTEAMILNGKARQKNARDEFNNLLAILLRNLNEMNNDHSANKKMCDEFNNFCVKSTRLERAYNIACENIVSVLNIINENVFLIEKAQKVNINSVNKKIVTLINKSINPFVINNNDPILKEVSDYSINGVSPNDYCEHLKKLKVSLENIQAKDKPNFFRLGYYKMIHPDFDESSLPVKELDAVALKELDDNFMKKFIELGSLGVKHSEEITVNKKEYLLPLAKELLELVKNTDNLVDKKIISKANVLKKLVASAINDLRIDTSSAEYSFGSSLDHEFERYREAIKNNPKNQKRFDVRTEKFNKLVEKGKNPSWKVVPPYIIDTDAIKDNVIRIITSIIKRYTKDVERFSEYDAKGDMINLIDLFKELASRYVYKVTRSIAKAKALELFKEVGIPEPELRFKQYPFEFSGGMRQRIVIAIALSANPDILICDEPTTALDVTIQSQILELINKIKKERNLSVIFITHDLGVVANMADKIAVMYAGKVVEYGTADDIFYDPRHPYTWALLASMPDLDTKEKLEAIPGTPPNMIYPPKGDAFADRNKYALKIDYEKEPPLFEISSTHKAATWLLHPNAPKVNPPKAVTDRIARMKKLEKEASRK